MGNESTSSEDTPEAKEWLDRIYAEFVRGAIAEGVIKEEKDLDEIWEAAQRRASEAKE